MTSEEQIKKIYEFIRKEHICVLSTLSVDSKPQSAAMAFSETEKLELFLSTSNKTRKYENLRRNPNVAIVIGMDYDKFITVQYEGVASEVGGEDFEFVKKLHTTKNQESKKYADSPDNRYFKVTPLWVRYWDIKGNEKIEISF